MLVIRKEQIDVMGAGMMKAFENEMVEHLAAFSPPLYAVIKEPQMREVVRFGFKQADKYGLTLRGPIRLYLEMMLLFGGYFDTDPQYPWARDILSDKHSVSQMQRAEWLFEKIVDYQEKVAGPKGANTRKALETLAEVGKQPMDFSPKEFEDSMRREVYRIFPEKAEYVGRENLTVLVRAARDEARKYQFPETRGDTLMVVLKFAFGHGCAGDPLYPWIGNTLRDERITTPEARASRLERKALNWLDAVLAGSLGSGEEI